MSYYKKRANFNEDLKMIPEIVSNAAHQHQLYSGFDANSKIKCKQYNRTSNHSTLKI